MPYKRSVQMSFSHLIFEDIDVMFLLNSSNEARTFSVNVFIMKMYYCNIDKHKHTAL